MEAFEAIYRKHVDPVFRYVVQRVGRHDVAEDITSEVFLKLHENWAQIDQTQLPNWLFTVARNASAAYWRHRAVELRHERETAEEMSRPEEGNWIFESRQLKPVHRMCLVLRYVHDMDRGEIARRMGLSETQVKGYLQYARELLRRQLSGGTR